MENEGRTRILVANRIRTPDGTILQSMHRRDYVCHTDANGGVYCVDGGIAYTKRNFTQYDYTDANVYLDDPYEEVRSAFHWGSFRNEDRLVHSYVPLKDLEREHILAILQTQTHITKWMRVMFKYELKYRRALLNESVEIQNTTC